MPSSTSRPAPHGSQSTRNTSAAGTSFCPRAAAQATAAANTDAPAPPQAPRTATQRPFPLPAADGVGQHLDQRLRRMVEPHGPVDAQPDAQFPQIRAWVRRPRSSPRRAAANAGPGPPRGRVRRRSARPVPNATSARFRVPAVRHLDTRCSGDPQQIIENLVVLRDHQRSIGHLVPRNPAFPGTGYRGISSAKLTRWHRRSGRPREMWGRNSVMGTNPQGQCPETDRFRRTKKCGNAAAWRASSQRSGRNANAKVDRQRSVGCMRAHGHRAVATGKPDVIWRTTRVRGTMRPHEACPAPSPRTTARPEKSGE